MSTTDDSSSKTNGGFLFFKKPLIKDRIFILFLVISVGIFALALYDSYDDYSGLRLFLYLLTLVAVTVVYVYVPLLIILLPRKFIKRKAKKIRNQIKSQDGTSLATGNSEAEIVVPVKSLPNFKDITSSIEKFSKNYRVPILIFSSLFFFLPIALLLEPYLPVYLVLLSAPVFSYLFIRGLNNLEKRSLLKAKQLENRKRLHNEKMKKLKESMTAAEWANYLLNLEISASLKKLNEPKYQPGARFGVFKQLDEE